MEAVAIKPKKQPPKVAEVNASPEGPPNNLIQFNLRHDLTDGFEYGMVQEYRFDPDQRCGENASLVDKKKTVKLFVLMFGKEKRNYRTESKPVEVYDFVAADGNFAMHGSLCGKHIAHEVAYW